MTKINVRTAAGKKAGSVELPADVFDVTVNVPLIHQVVVAQLAAARRGTHSTKPGARSPAAGASPTARRAPAERGRARSARRNSRAAVSCTVRRRATTPSGHRRR